MLFNLTGREKENKKRKTQTSKAANRRGTIPIDEPLAGHKLMEVSVFGRVGERTREGNNLYNEINETGVKN